MNNKFSQVLFSISLKTRILRAWQKSNSAQDQDFSERDLLTLELIADFAPITEKGLCKIFGLSFSSVNDIVKKFVSLGLVKDEKERGETLALTEGGRKRLAALKQASATRFNFLFEGLGEKDETALHEIFQKIDKNVERNVQQLVFGRFETK
ncbi:MAG TPA: MarR family winged helix-turn-helix transcriptional regulator [Verrucomicrobiae bacterium]|jgi:DNA-binding MarR family transcriptional regulator|nr:MarR family winged helix-turn-helix transcriptional regulator [Verrucomicrobiae bacterium]